MAVAHPQGSASLDTRYTKYDRTLWRRWTRRPFCPSMPAQVIDAVEVQMVRCRSQACFACSFAHRRQVIDAIEATQPRRMLTLTGLPDDLAEAQGCVRKYSRFLRAHRVENMTVLERFVSGGLHAHTLTHGARLPASALLRGARAQGIQSVHITEFPIGRFHAQAYLLKNTTRPEGLEQHLTDNHGHLVYLSTQSFWRDVTTGELYGGLTKAKEAARKRYVVAAGSGG